MKICFPIGHLIKNVFACYLLAFSEEHQLGGSAFLFHNRMEKQASRV